MHFHGDRAQNGTNVESDKCDTAFTGHARAQVRRRGGQPPTKVPLVLLRQPLHEGNSRVLLPGKHRSGAVAAQDHELAQPERERTRPSVFNRRQAFLRDQLLLRRWILLLFRLRQRRLRQHRRI